MIGGLAAGVLTFLTVPALLPLYERQKVKNYRGELVPTGLGLAFILPAVLVIMVGSTAASEELLGVVLLLFFALLGAIDDALGDHSQKGFRGHLAGGHFSTGTLKAVGGGAVALVAARLLTDNLLEAGLNAALVALGANLINLFDLRPGRAGKAFLLLSLPFQFWAVDVGALRVLAFAVLGYLPWDLKRRAMMGDTGANPLGAALGWLAGRELPLLWKIILFLFLAFLTVFAERVSFSEVIERNSFLRFLDQLGR